MESVNSAFILVAQLIVKLQVFFTSTAWAIGRICLTIAVFTTVINYALTGQGLKENLIKSAKALLFFTIIMGAYPSIISWITTTTYNWASAAYGDAITRFVEDEKRQTVEILTVNYSPQQKSRFGYRATTSTKVTPGKDPTEYFENLERTFSFGNITYFYTSPSAALKLVMIVAGSILEWVDKQGLNIGAILGGFFCAFLVIITGALCILEYVMAYLEFMFVTSVGIILFPLSLWEGSKFMSEKFIQAILGFFLKLLFCNICIFLMIVGYISLSRGYIANAFTGKPDEYLVLVFSSLLFFIICKSAPGMAQGLLTGAPSLSASGAISSVAGAGAAIIGGAMLAGKAAGCLAKGATKGIFAGKNMLAKAGAARDFVKGEGGTKAQQAGAFLSSMGDSAATAMKSKAHNLSRSLLGGGSGGGGGGGSGGAQNRFSDREDMLNTPNKDGQHQTWEEHFEKSRQKGAESGLDYAIAHNINAGPTTPQAAAQAPASPPASQAAAAAEPPPKPTAPAGAAASSNVKKITDGLAQAAGADSGGQRNSIARRSRAFPKKDAPLPQPKIGQVVK